MTIYDFTVKDRLGKEVSLETYKGKVLLVVNTAIKCGLTPQYEELEALYQKYQSQGFELLDFPCNQFLNQAPGTDEDINHFCTLTYNTTFPRFSKIDVNGDKADPLYVWLKEEKPEDTEDQESKSFEKKVKAFTLLNKPADIKWNFGKFLIDQQGNVVNRYSPAYDMAAIDADIKALLD